jgi:parvulin-like peptidyl-prolyl isomerase
VRSKLSIFARALFAAAVLALGAPSAALAQEGEPVVIDSVVAQVNGDVVMLSMVKREIKETIENLKQQGMAEAKATEEVTRRQAELIASLVNEMLLVQKGKELNLTEEVENEVNREMLRVMNQQGFKSINEMEEAMRREGIDPSSIRQTIRTQYMKNAVLSNEVDRKIFDSITATEAQKYYEVNRDRFRKPESVSLSEIFLNFAGRREEDVRAKAQALLTQLRGGADFATIAASTSERPESAANKGKVGTFSVPDLNADIVAAIKDVRPGGVTELIRSEQGYQILRVDERTPMSEPVPFDENKVRELITIERREKERAEYMKKLRRDAYIRLAEEYKPTVGPLLATDAAKPAATSPAASNSTNKTDGNKRP